MQQIIISVVLSFFLPGLGQLYNRNFKKGFLLIFFTLVLFFLPSIWLVLKIAPQLPITADPVLLRQSAQMLVLKTVKENVHILDVISFVFLGVWAYSMTQAYFGAKEINETATENSKKPSDGV